LKFSSNCSVLEVLTVLQTVNITLAPECIVHFKCC